MADGNDRLVARLDVSWSAGPEQMEILGCDPAAEINRATLRVRGMQARELSLARMRVGAERSWQSWP